MSFISLSFWLYSQFFSPLDQTTLSIKRICSFPSHYTHTKKNLSHQVNSHHSTKYSCALPSHHKHHVTSPSNSSLLSNQSIYSCFLISSEETCKHNNTDFAPSTYPTPEEHGLPPPVATVPCHAGQEDALHFKKHVPNFGSGGYCVSSIVMTYFLCIFLLLCVVCCLSFDLYSSSY